MLRKYINAVNNTRKQISQGHIRLLVQGCKLKACLINPLAENVFSGDLPRTDLSKGWPDSFERPKETPEKVEAAADIIRDTITSQGCDRSVRRI